MASSVISRRAFLERCAVLGAAVGAGSLIAACSSETTNGNAANNMAGGDTGGEAVALDCTDTSALTETDLATREGLEYVDMSVNPDQNCLNCEHYEEGEPNACGTCALVPGPINPEGWCASWAEKVS